MAKIVTFGETMGQYNAEFVGEYGADGAYMLDCAGAESNMAADLMRLGLPGVEAVWVSKLGDDEAGNAIASELRGRLTMRAPLVPGARTGLSYLNHHADGEHVKTYFRAGSAASHLRFSDVEPHLRGADLLHVTGITPALSADCRQAVFDALARAASDKTPVSFDLNYRAQLWPPAEARGVFERMARASSIFKFGQDEAASVWGGELSAREWAARFQRLNGGVAVATRGMDGAVAFDGDTFVEHPGYRVDVVDPVGAGDAFVAGLIGGILEWGDVRSFLGADAERRAAVLSDALRIANACGALTCARRGDTAAMPTMPEARRFIADAGDAGSGAAG